jgi:hypothetical protein
MVRQLTNVKISRQGGIKLMPNAQMSESYFLVVWFSFEL